MQRIRTGLCILGMGVFANVAWAADEKPIDFAHEIVPILKAHCVECHGGEQSKGGFSLNTRELLLDSEAAVPGKPEESRLLELVTSKDPADQMPPKDKARVKPKEIALLTRWIQEGAKWDAGVTFAKEIYQPPLKPCRPELPAAQNGRTNPVDRIVDAYFAERKITPTGPISDETFARRVYLDIVGLLPTPEQLTEFLEDPATNRRERLVKSLLDNRGDYAEHWMTFWNDLLRNDYAGTGFITKGRKQISPWLYQSLLDNKPYDQFVQDLITPVPGAEGFIEGIRWRGVVNASQRREIQFAQNISQAFLGINLKCASCHDSFIDHWTLEETYGLAQLYAKEPLELHRCDKPTGQNAKAAWLFPELGQVDANAAQPERMKQLAGLMTHPENGRLTRTIVNRIWHRLMGRGIVHPVDAMHTRPWNEDLLDYLAVHLTDHNYDLKQTIALICTSEIYQSQTPVSEEASGPEFVFRGPLPKRLTAEQFLDSVWQLTGSAPQKIHAPVKRPTDSAGNVPMVRAALLKADEMMRALGRPNRDQIVTMRPNELTTLEAIELANGQSLADAIAAGAGRLQKRFATDIEGLVQYVFRFALSRKPTEQEQTIAVKLLGSPPKPQAVEDLIWSLLMLPEFQFVR